MPAVVREGALHQLGGSLVRCLMMITLLVVIMTNAARIMVSCSPSKSVHNKHGGPPEVLTSNPCLHNALLPSNIYPKSIPTPKPLTLSPAAALSEPHLLSQPLTSCCTTRLSSKNGCGGVERKSEAQLTSKEWLGANMGSGQVSPHRLHQLKVRPIGQENKQRHRWHEQSAGQRQVGLVFLFSWSPHL